MATCPTCKIGLQTVRQREGLYYYCSECNGRAVTVPQIRRMTGDRFAAGLVRKMNTATQVSSRACPFCLSSMKSFEVSDPPVTLDSCKPCVTVWFDAGKFEVLPEGVLDSPEEVLFTAAELEAKRKLQQDWALGEDYTTDASPDEAWKWIPAAIGLPVKYYTAEMSRRPWTTWSLSAIIAIVSVCAFPNLETVVKNFGTVPAHAFRYGGATFLTSFFLHAGWAHLLGNLYIFLLAGGEVEDFLGWWRFLVLIFSAAIVGNIFYVVSDPHSEVPGIGASGGIAGVLMFYTFKFPRARLAFFWLWLWFRQGTGWIRVPAWALFLLWFLLQILGAMEQMYGFSDVNSLAHLGGVTMGFLLWLAWRKLGEKKAVEE
ncbi:MAG TPA: rhomboid family intramembrane serine protease [Candidatus Acidoferrales bacterium]|jgi:membrane associated rhomboid family serine protease|nr:rhomboid family intramembrane serine protease [Candidatus Acidoferrales bacterium]